MAIQPSPRPAAELLRPRDVAALLDVTTETIRGWIRRGLLKAVRIGGTQRIPRGDIDALIANRAPPPPATGGVQ